MKNHGGFTDVRLYIYLGRIMKTTFAIFFLFFSIALFAQSIDTSRLPVLIDLPKEAVIVEVRRLPSPVDATRALVLWMIEPVKHPREAPDESYTCPEITMGHYYEGPTRVSLLDLKTWKIINTIEIRSPYIEVGDSYRIPYLIKQGEYYKVEQVKEYGEGIPTILAYADINNDGYAYEFALYDAIACMGLHTTLIGYSNRQDKVIQYPVKLTLTGPSDTDLETVSTLWADYFFSQQPESDGTWNYSIDYSG